MGRILPVLFLDLTPFIGAGLGWLAFLHFRRKVRRAAARRAGSENLNREVKK